MDVRLACLCTALALALSACDVTAPLDEAKVGPARPATLKVSDPAATPPVLLPLDPALRASAQIIQVGRSVTVTAAAAGVEVQITSVANTGPDSPPVVQQTEYGFDASFLRQGGLYNVTVTCREPKDTRCADEGFIRSLIAGLTPR
jgi:hypothetical protein